MKTIEKETTIRPIIIKRRLDYRDFWLKVRKQNMRMATLPAEAASRQKDHEAGQCQAGV